MNPIISYIIAHPYEIIAALNAFIAGLIAISLIIPGEQPEKALGIIADLLAKISKK